MLYPLIVLAISRSTGQTIKKGGDIVKLVDELYELYRGRIRGTEEDLDMITLTVLEHLSREELLEMIHDMEHHELEYFVRLYIFESLKQKIIKEEDQDISSSEYRHLH